MPMKGTIFKGILLILFLGVGETAVYSQQQQRKDTLVVTRDGTGDYRNIQEAVEAVRAFMDYTVTIYIKNGTYKEKAGNSLLGQERSVGRRKRRKYDYHLRRPCQY